jgi:hypothetical protein
VNVSSVPAFPGLTSKPIPLNFSEDIIFNGITIQGINGRRMYQTWYQTTALLKDRTPRPPPRDHRPPSDERLLESHGPPKNRPSQQNPDLPQPELTLWRSRVPLLPLVLLLFLIFVVCTARLPARNQESNKWEKLFNLELLAQTRIERNQNCGSRHIPTLHSPAY